MSIFTQRWLPDETPRALVLLAHGLGEHSGRYAHVAAHLTKHGYGVCALDHQGHGRSEGKRMVATDYEDTYVADLRTCFDASRAEYPDRPIVLYGHSVGSLVALLFAFHHQDELAGLITSGTLLKPMASNAIVVLLVKTANRFFPGMRTLAIDANAVSRDPAVSASYRTDPLVHRGRIPLGSLAALQKAIETCIEQLPTLRLPVLALHGRKDSLALVKGAEIVRERSGAPDTTVTIYDDLYHEVHNEPEQEQVLQDVTDWLDSRII